MLIGNMSVTYRLDINNPPSKSYGSENYLSPPTYAKVHPSQTSVSLTASSMPPRHLSKGYTPKFEDEHAHQQMHHKGVSTATQISPQTRKLKDKLKRNQTFNFPAVHGTAHYTNSFPRSSFKVKVTRKKPSSDSFSPFKHHNNKRYVAPYRSIQTENTLNNMSNIQTKRTIPKNLRHKTHSMIETKKEYECSQNFDRIPSVVVWQESNQHDMENPEDHADDQEKDFNNIYNSISSNSYCVSYYDQNIESHV